MEFEKEKEFVLDALSKNHRLSCDGFRYSLDELYNLLQFRRKIALDRTTGDAMLLSIYLIAKRACHSVHILKAVTEGLIIDPFKFPYREYAEKFRSLIDDYEWWSHIVTDTLAPFWDGLGIIDNDDYERIYGVKKESLFEDNSEDKSAPNVSKEALNVALDTLLDREWFLQKSISDCLKDITDTLEGIDDALNCNDSISIKSKECLRERINAYMSHKQWTDDRKELYNIIRMKCMNGMESRMLPMIKTELYLHLRRNRLGETLLGDGNLYWWESENLGYIQPLTQAELNECLRLSSQYELICKLVDYVCQWNVRDKDSFFIDRGTEYMVNALIPVLAKKAGFSCLFSYGALWEALIDLNLLSGASTYHKKLFIKWVNGTFQKDKNKKFKSITNLTKSVEGLSKLQTKKAEQRQFKDLAEEEFDRLTHGKLMKESYPKCVLILADYFDLNLEELNFQSYITEPVDKRLKEMKKIPKDPQSGYILECQRAYEEFKRYKP